MINIQHEFKDRIAVLQFIQNISEAQNDLTELALCNGSTERRLFAQRELAGIISKTLEQLEDFEEGEERKRE